MLHGVSNTVVGVSMTCLCRICIRYEHDILDDVSDFLGYHNSRLNKRIKIDVGFECFLKLIHFITKTHMSSTYKNIFLSR